MKDPDILKFMSPGCQRFAQRHGLSAIRTDIDPVPRVDESDRFFRCD